MKQKDYKELNRWIESNIFGRKVFLSNDGLKDRLLCPPGTPIPQYSTCFASAHKVIVKMKELGWYVEMDNNSLAGLWMVRFWQKTIRPKWTEDELPLAICLAAKKAIELEAIQ